MKSVLSFQGSETSALLPIPESARQLGPEELQLLLLILGKAPLSESTAPGFQNYFQKALLLDIIQTVYLQVSEPQSPSSQIHLQIDVSKHGKGQHGTEKQP